MSMFPLKNVIWLAILSLIAAPLQSENLTSMPRWPSKLTDEKAILITNTETLDQLKTKDRDQLEIQSSEMDSTSMADIPEKGKRGPDSQNIDIILGRVEKRVGEEDGETSSDPITAEQIKLLRDNGLIARQAAISESIIVMERQLKQAELIRDLMRIFGPEAPIEIAPGDYRTFSHTPAGRKIAFDIQEAEALARIRLLELEAAESVLLGHNLEADDIETVVPIDDIAPLSPKEVIWPELLEVLGTRGELHATLRFDGTTLNVDEGDILPNGVTVLKVSADTVLLSHGTIEHEIELGW